MKTKFLVDTRDEKNEGSILNQHIFANKYLKEFRDFKMAVIHRKDDDVMQFMETVARNYGNFVSVFYSTREATSWLK